LLFSQKQLSSILNDSTTFLTIERNSTILQERVSRIKISDLRLNTSFKEELDDWKHEASLNEKLPDLYFIPYEISSDGSIEESLSFMNAYAEEISSDEAPLQSGDRIIAVNGTQINNSFDILKQLQEPVALLIVQKNPEPFTISWEKADAAFHNSFDIASLNQIIQSIGDSNPKTEAGSFKLLSPIHLKSLSDLDLDTKTRAQITMQYEAQKKAIEKMENAQEREMNLSLLEQSQKRLMLGALLTDSTVSYNPDPVTQFFSVFSQTWKTLTNLFTGSLTPKSMSGPVGIVQVLQQSWATSAKDALFWLGFVSLNLAVLNLLPIPVLDGGHILFAVVEMVTGKPIASKTMERWILPFLILLVVLFIYLTYQDIGRLFHRLF
jgi:regulator of sigma E protease